MAKEAKEKKVDPEEVEVWDKKKLFVAFVLVAVVFAAVGYFAKPYLKDFLATNTLAKVEKQKVHGATTKQYDSPLAPEQVQERIAEIQQQITQLDADEVASSSPQIQKIMKDMKSLQEYPRTQAKEMCQQLCSKL